MKKYIARLLLICVLLSVLAVLPALPATAAVPRLSTDKRTYAVGEPILVTAIGEGKDWVGLYLAEDSYDPGAGGQVSIYWYYVAADGNAAGETKNIFESEYNNIGDRPAFAAGLPAGAYRLVLMENDGYHVLECVDIEIVDTAAPDTPGQAPSAPASAIYTSAGAGKGRADGTLTVTPGASQESYVIRWGNSDGALAGYTDVAVIRAEDGETVYTFPESTLIPVGADRLLVYGQRGTLLSDRPAVAELPAGAGDYDLGKPLLELQIMSDIHINASDVHIHNRHFAAALKDIQAVSPNSAGILINGDIADNGQPAEYEAYNRLLATAGALPPVYAAIGNHDFMGSGTAAQLIKAFLAGTGNDSETVYFERELGGLRCLFLGSEKTGLYATLSKKQLDWLDKRLDENTDGRPVLVFLHQGIMDTVAGTFAYQQWHGVNQEKELRAILGAHPEVILFSGHSHWEMESAHTFKLADDALPNVLGTSSCAYLWDDGCMTTNVGIEGSQGYYMYVYEDRIVFRGRDFASGLWIGSAQFTMSRLDAPESDTSIPDTTPPDAMAPETEDLSPADTTAPAGETAATEETGCASAVCLASVTLLTLLGSVVLRRREEFNR